jgi:Flp pilus assembly protein TadG
MFTPLLIFLLSLTLQFAMIWYARQIAQAAAREGARVARSEQGTTAAAQARAQTYANQIGSDVLLGVAVTPKRDEVTGVASVEVHGQAIRLLWTQQVRARSEGPIEVFRPAGG